MLGRDLAREVPNPGHVAAGAAETRDRPASHGIGDERKHDGNDGGRGLRRKRGGRRVGHDHFDLQRDEFRRKRRHALVAAVRMPGFDDEILAFDPSKRGEPLANGRVQDRESGVGLEHSDALHRLRLRLRVRAWQNGGRSDCNQRQHRFTPVHAIPRSESQATPAARFQVREVAMLRDGTISGNQLAENG